MFLSLVLTDQEDNIAMYYQQQVEMLEGFNEMDALADRGFVPGMSKVLIVLSAFTICIRASSICIRPTVCSFFVCTQSSLIIHKLEGLIFS